MIKDTTLSHFLSLIRLGVGNSTDKYIGDADWDALQALSNEHGLSAVLVDGVEQIPEDYRPPKPILLQWIGETLQGYEYRYELYRKAIADLAAFYNQHGFKMMVLKGYACSQNWPKPDHRPCGDIDMWQFGQQREADAVLETSFKVHDPSFKIDKSHHIHTVFNWRGFTVENHYDFINVHHHRSHVGLERIFKELGTDDSHVVKVCGEKIYLPSPNLHALFIVRHALNHFASIGINLRQVLDWAFFVRKHTKEIDWKWLNRILEEYHMKDFYGCLNAICVEDLGFDASIFNGVQFNPSLKDRVLREILNPEYSNDLPNYLIPRLLFKFKRWRGSAWKRELCYNESLWSGFWSGVWNHLLKPASI